MSCLIRFIDNEVVTCHVMSRVMERICDINNADKTKSILCEIRKISSGER